MRQRIATQAVSTELVRERRTSHRFSLIMLSRSRSFRACSGSMSPSTTGLQHIRSRPVSACMPWLHDAFVEAGACMTSSPFGTLRSLSELCWRHNDGVFESQMGSEGCKL